MAMIKKTRAQALTEWRDRKLGYSRRPKDADRLFFYELRKRALTHKNLSPQEYEAAVQKIAKELGL